MTIYIKDQLINLDYISSNCDVTYFLPYLIQLKDTNFYVVETVDSLTAEDYEIISNKKIDIVLYLFFTHVTRFHGEHFFDPNITLITWEYKSKFKNHIYCPYFAFDDFYNDVPRLYSNKNNVRKFIYSCLNNLARPHRVATVYKLFELTNFNNGIVSLSKTCLYHPHEILTIDNLENTVLEFTTINSLIAKELFDILPINAVHEVRQDVWKLGETPMGHPSWKRHPAYFDSYFNLVTETNWHCALVSEKTFKPVISEQFFILVAGPGSVNLLRSLGFDVYDDIIDHSYDNCDDSLERFRLIFAEFQRLPELDWPNIYLQTYERRRNNKELLFSGQIKKQFFTNFKSYIKENSRWAK